MKVKICGLTTLEDASAAAEAGADFLGFNFYPKSPRYLAPEACREIVAKLKALSLPCLGVGVFVNHSPEEVRRIVDFCGLELAQLSGDEPPAALAALADLNVGAFKALRPADAAALAEALRKYPGLLSAHATGEFPAYLIDAYRPGEYGGTGLTANWSLATQLARRHAIFLAGGLVPENVATAVAQVQPWGVDVASGVESTPGRKDAAKVRAFIAAAKDHL